MHTGSVSLKTDVVLIKSNDAINFVVGQIWRFASVEDLDIALVSLWELDSYSQTLGKATWRIVDRPLIVGLEDLRCSVIWSETSPGIANTLVPYQFRGLQAVAE